MNEIPEWWLGLSGLFFGLGIVVLLATLVATIYLVFVLKDLAQKLKSMSAKVEQMGQQASEILAQTKETTRALGMRASSIAERVDEVSSVAVRRFEIISVGLIALTALLRFRKKRAVKS